MKLSACVIGKGRELLFQNMLVSIVGLVDEVIYGFTGDKDDNSVFHAERFGAKVFRIGWEDSFSIARNATLSKANGDYIFVIDTDEVIDTRHHCVLREHIYKNKYDGIQVNVYSDTKTGYSKNPSMRIFRNGICHYKYRVQNALEGFGGDVLRTDAIIRHVGYDLSPADMLKKSQFREKLFKLQLQETPDDLYIICNYIKHLRCMFRYNEVIEYSERLFKHRVDPLTNSVQMAISNMIYSMMQMRNYKEAERVCEYVLSINEDNLDVLFYYAGIALEQGKCKDALYRYKAFLSALYKDRECPDDYVYETYGQESRALYAQSICYEELEDKENAFIYAEKACNIQPDDKYYALQKAHTWQVKQSDTLKVLFIQAYPCIRSWKMATALKKAGVDVYLGYGNKRHEERYPGLEPSPFVDEFKITEYQQIKEIGKSFDIVHCHNEPDDFTVAATLGRTKVIHDIHDLRSMTNSDGMLHMLEKSAMELADGLIFVSKAQYGDAISRYNIKSHVAIFCNYASESLNPDRYLDKLEGLHAVYQGGIGVWHKDIRNLLINLTDLGVTVHVYPTNPLSCDYLQPNKLLKIYDPLPPKELIETMTQYSFGLVYLNYSPELDASLKHSLPNKLFEYMQAGLPVMTLDWMDSSAEYVERHNCGCVMDINNPMASINEVITKIPILKTYEQESWRLIIYYERVIGNDK